MPEDLKKIIEENNLLLESIDIQIWYLIDEKTYGRVNEAHAEFLGLNKSEIEYKKIEEIFEEEAEILIQGNKKVFNQKKKIKTKVWSKNSKGEKRLLSITKSPKLNEKNEIEYVVCYAEDITEKAEMEKARERYQILFETSPVGMIIEDSTGKILEVNKTITKMTGYSKLELEGSNILDTLTPPENREESKEKIKRIINGEDLDFETKGIYNQNEIHFTRLKETRITLPGGNPGILSMQIDITQQKLEKLKLDALFKNSTSAIAMLDSKGNIENINNEFTEVFGYQLNEIKGENIDDLWAKNKKRYVDKDSTKMNLEGKKTKGKGIRYDKYNNPKEVFYHGIPIVIEDVVEGTYAIYDDVTDLKEKERIIENLHEISVDFQKLTDEKEVCEKTVEVAKEILKFEFCNVRLVKNEKLINMAVSSKVNLNLEPRSLNEKSISSKTYREKESILIKNIKSSSGVDPVRSNYKSGISIPIGDLGVFQAISDEKAAYSEKDLELGELLISHTTAALERINSQAELAEKHRDLQKTKSLLDSEINKAKDLHEKTLIKNIKDFKGLNTYIYYHPAAELGGDFYDFIELDEKRLLFYLIDVTGHGLDSAIMSSFVKNIINAYVELMPADKKIEPKQLIEFIYKQNKKNGFPDDYFITMILGLINLEEKTLNYSSAGLHIPPVICKGYIEELPAGNLPISNAYSCSIEYDDFKIDLTEGDTLFFTTDGLVEQAGKDGIYGYKYKEIICQNNYLPPGAIVQEINRDFNEFYKGKVKDDITFAIIQLEKDKDYPELSFAINSNKAEIDRAKQKVEEFIKFQNVNINIHDISMAFHEMLINALEHGNKFDESKKIEIRVILNDKFIQLSVKDEGEGFNWMQVKEEKAGTILDIQDEVATRGRGLGFMMARTVSDYFYYNYKGNQVNFIKEY